MGLEDIILQGPKFMITLTVIYSLSFLQNCFRWDKAQCFRRYSHHIVLLKCIDCYVGCQSWFQFQVIVGCRDHHLVGYHITLCSSLLAYLRHLSLKMILRECIHSEAHALTFFHTTNISLIDICNHTHVCQVLGNAEQLWRIKRSCYGLAFFHRL